MYGIYLFRVFLFLFDPAASFPAAFCLCCEKAAAFCLCCENALVIVVQNKTAQVKEPSVFWREPLNRRKLKILEVGLVLSCPVRQDSRQDKTSTSQDKKSCKTSCLVLHLA